VPRGLTPVPRLHDDAIALEPLSRRLAPELAWVLAPDADMRRFTLLPTRPDDRFLERWLGRYEEGWSDGSCAGFAARAVPGDAVVAFAGFVRLDLERREGELGYVVDPAARGRGIASRAVSLLTRWGFEELGLERIELRIDPANAASSRVAERAGYRLDGVLRNRYFKEGLRGDEAVWSRVPTD